MSDDRKYISTKVMENMMRGRDHDLGPVTPAMKKLQEKYLAGRMDWQDFSTACDVEVQKLAREGEEQRKG